MMATKRATRATHGDSLYHRTWQSFNQPYKKNFATEISEVMEPALRESALQIPLSSPFGKGGRRGISPSMPFSQG